MVISNWVSTFPVPHKPSTKYSVLSYHLQVLANPRPPSSNITNVLALANVATDNIDSCANLSHLIELEGAFSTLTKPFLLLIQLLITVQRIRVPQCLAAVVPDLANSLLQLSLDTRRRQRSEQIHLVRRNQHWNLLWALAGLRIGVPLLQTQEHIVKVLCRLVQPSFLIDGSGVHHKDDAADIFRIGELGGSVVAQLAMAGGVEDKEAARALECWVTRRAVVRGGGDVRVWEESFD